VAVVAELYTLGTNAMNFRRKTIGLLALLAIASVLLLRPAPGIPSLSIQFERNGHYDADYRSCAFLAVSNSGTASLIC
jgi:hypothetical protein